MRLRSIRLINYRRYRDASVEFPDGLIGIVGRNGAGKSSLMEAILWALFGHEAARTGKELLKRQDAAPGEDVLVRLEFEADGHGFAVTRRLRGKNLQPEAAIEADGTLLVSPGANSWEQANETIPRILGFDRASFESTVVARQGELAALSELRPAQRKRLLLDMLGIERIETAIQSCRSEGRLLEARLGEARRALETESVLRARRQEATVRRDEAKQRLEALQQALSAATERAQQERLRAEHLLDAKIRDQELRVRLQGLQGRLETLWTQRSRLAADAQILREREQEGLRLRRQLAAFDGLDEDWDGYEAARRAVDERTRLQRRLDAVEAELGRWRPLTDAGARNGSSPSHLEAKLAGFADALERETQEYMRLGAERARCRHEIDSLQAPEDTVDPASLLGPDDECPVCERRLGKSLEKVVQRRQTDAAQRAVRRAALETTVAQLDSLRTETERRRAKAQEEKEATVRKLEAVRQRLRDAELAVREVARLETERDDLQSSMAALPAETDAEQGRLLVARRAERNRLQELALRAEEAARRLPRVRDEERVLHAEEARIVEEREKASRELQHLAYPPGAWEQAKRSSDAAQRERETLERDEVQWRERLVAWERETSNLEQEVRRLDEARARLDADLGRLKVLETVAASRGDGGILPEFKAHLVGRIRPALARSAGTLVRQMTAGRYAEVLLDDDYGVHLYDGALAHPMERFSGGEQDVTNLCLRLAVSELVANARGRSRLQFVALDEVFGSQDGERRETVVRCLAGLSNVFRQVFVVTHLDDVRDRLEHVLRIDEGPDGSSRITRDA